MFVVRFLRKMTMYLKFVFRTNCSRLLSTLILSKNSSYFLGLKNSELACFTLKFDKYSTFFTYFAYFALFKQGGLLIALEIVLKIYIRAKFRSKKIIYSCWLFRSRVGAFKGKWWISSVLWKSFKVCAEWLIYRALEKQFPRFYTYFRGKLLYSDLETPFAS